MDQAMSIELDDKNVIVMKLLHYFITEKNYNPIILQGAENEIWLENMDEDYKIVRIVSNYIHNNEQFIYDNNKIRSIVKQVKKKTFFFKMKTLNVLLDVGENVDIKDNNDIENFKISNFKDLRSDDNISGLFPKLKTMSLKREDNFETIINITNDINTKSAENNKRFEKIFSPKKIVVTKLLVIINVVVFLLTLFSAKLFNLFILDPVGVRNGEIWRLITSMFMHGSIYHLFVNMYSLAILGNQVETFLGKKKFLIIYFISGITGSMLSCILTNSYSLGASGAIFGLLGSLLYFGLQYRLFLGSILLREIVPIIILNLMIGFMFEGIDNAAHIGGLIGGIFATLAVGVDSRTQKSSKINGWITLTILILFLSYLLFFR